MLHYNYRPGYIMTACAVRDLHIQETVLFLISAVWVALFTVANWKKLWK